MAQSTTFYNMLTGAHVVPQDWQLELKVGDYYIINSNGDPTGTRGMPPIYGRIESAKGAGGKGFFWAKGYSLFCPDGETGIVCICDPDRALTAEEFEAAKKRGWR